ncbi:MAG: hypothetical protein K2X66_14910, partial [Cyanobacteria bacterium]|nr:hypothetical protein [Cyanobacteriota bacterium]
MIIKKSKNQPLPPAEDPQALLESSVTSEEWAASHHPQEPEPVEDPWDQLAYEAGMLHDRRNQDRRYGYRRAEEKNALSSAYQEAD